MFGWCLFKELIVKLNWKMALACFFINRIMLLNKLLTIYILNKKLEYFFLNNNLKNAPF